MTDHATWSNVRDYARQIVDGRLRPWEGGRKILDVWEACGEEGRSLEWSGLLEYDWDWVDLFRNDLSPSECQKRETEIQNKGDARIICAAEQLLAPT